MDLTLNGHSQTLGDEQAPQPLLWWLREDKGLTGTRYGCGEGVCGACTVHLDGQAVRSCITPCHAADGRELTTIEGLARGDTLHPVQQAWLELAVAQCGYCQSGQIMGAAALLASTPNPSDEQIDAAMAGNLCRCATYPRIREAVRAAAKRLQG